MRSFREWKWWVPSRREGLAQPLPPILGIGAPHPTTPAILRALRAGPQPRLLCNLTES